jgi:hypothetical protein
MGALTPEKKAGLKKALAGAKPTHDKMRELSSEEQARWDKEIAALESRVHTEVTEIDLGNGSSIAIRTCLSNPEIRRLNALETANNSEPDPQRKAEMAAEMLEIITASPLITKEWLMANLDKYSPSDVLRVLLGFREVRARAMVDHVERLRSASTFRQEPCGPELRALPPLPQSDRPT